MMFRYHGDRHAGAQQFAPLVDRRAGGIATGVLADAIRARGWEIETPIGSIDVIRDNLAAGRPVMLLLEERPRRYHYVVAVGVDASAVQVHDPAWGPSRHLTHAELLRRWRAANFWTLVIAPPAPPTLPAVPAPPALPASPAQKCDLLLDAALDQIAANGLDAADRALASVQQQCPDANGPMRELAGVRFSQSRWDEAATLARRVLDRDPSERYAWDVLGSSLFVQDDLLGALEAWNHIGRPEIDAVAIDGLERTRYAFMAGLLPFSPNTRLTPRSLKLAERRLRDLPMVAAASVGYRPAPDGFAVVDVRVVERSREPDSRLEWLEAAIRALVDREVRAAVPGGTGQGELWTGRWRWWSDRPRIGIGFEAPAARLGGVWRVDAMWEAQTYRVGEARTEIRQEQVHGSLTFGSWLTPALRYEIAAAADSWSGNRRTATLGAVVERRMLNDRLAAGIEAGRGIALSGGAGFSSGAAYGRFRTSTQPTGLVLVAHGRVDGVSRDAPLAEWTGAGEGRARPGLLRAHRLLRKGIVDGPVFGRRVASLNVEGQRWFARPALAPMALALFADVARAGARLPAAAGRPLQIDAGAGVRIRLPGRDGTFRIDYARGLRDGSHAVSVGWTVNSISGLPESSPKR